MARIEQVKQSQVDEQCDFLEKSIHQLAETIEQLEARLERILRGVEPKDEKEGVEVSLVPFANFLRKEAWDVQVNRNRLISILERLEL